MCFPTSNPLSYRSIYIFSLKKYQSKIIILIYKDIENGPLSIVGPRRPHRVA
jgi:hypothetical protein